MNDRSYSHLRPGYPISAIEMNRALDKISESSDVGGDIGVSNEFGQQLITPVAPPRINLRILSGENPYAWEEARQNELGAWYATGIRSGTTTLTPAVERNGATTVAAGSVYEAVFDAGPDGTGRWMFSASGEGEDEFFPVQIGCGALISGIWVCAWNEIYWDAAMGAAIVLAPEDGGRSGYPPQTMTITKTVTGTDYVDESNPGTAEVETITFCGPPLSGGVWTLGGATGLAYYITDSNLQDALQAALGEGNEVTVTGSMTSGFVITWPNVGVVTTLTGSVSGLYPPGPANPATELNNRKVKAGTNVWLKRGYHSDTPATIVATKTAAGAGLGMPATFSLYIDAASGGSFTITFDGFRTADIPYGTSKADIKTAIQAVVSGLSISTFAGSGTLADPWTFTVTSDYADHTMSANGKKLKGGDGYRFECPATLCNYEDVSGYTLGTEYFLKLDATGCLKVVGSSVCASTG